MKTGLYEHFKGGRYEAVDVVIRDGSREQMVLYYPLQGNDRTWTVRPLSEWNEIIERGEYSGPRFKLIEERSYRLDLRDAREDKNSSFWRKGQGFL